MADKAAVAKVVVETMVVADKEAAKVVVKVVAVATKAQ